MATALEESINLGAGIAQLLPALFGKKSVVSSSPSTETTQTQFSADALKALLTEKLSDIQGLEAVAGGQKRAGLYNSSTSQLLINDLLTRSAAEVEKARAPVVKTITGGTKTIRDSGALGKQSASLLPYAAFAMNKDVRKGAKSLYDMLFGEKAAPSALSAAGISNANFDGAFNALGSIGGAYGSDAGNAFSGFITNFDTPLNYVTYGSPASASAFGWDDLLGSYSDVADVADVADIGSDVFSSFAAGTSGNYLTDLALQDYADFGAEGVSALNDALGYSEAAAGFDMSGIPLSAGLDVLQGDFGGAAETAALYAVPVVGPALSAVNALTGGDVVEVVYDVVDDVGTFISDTLSDVGDALGSVICTELYRQHLMPAHIYEADQRFGKLQSTNVIAGYHYWAIPLVRLMQKSKLVTHIVSFFAVPWSKHMAYTMNALEKDNLFGRFLMATFRPICGFIGSHLPEK